MQEVKGLFTRSALQVDTNYLVSFEWVVHPVHDLPQVGLRALTPIPPSPNCLMKPAFAITVPEDVSYATARTIMR